jgi:hypothetical protein
MHNLHSPGDIEKALERLMPVALSERASRETNTLIDELSGETPTKKQTYRKWPAALGIAAAISLAAFISLPKSQPATQQTAAKESTSESAEPTIAFLAEADRVENVRDEGLYIDTGGSAVRKLRVRVVAETSIRDEETGIVFQLTSPREELHMLPVSTF